jgi:RIO-like serine/threonine protein kinase
MGNKILKFFRAGNHSFTGIVNHRAQDLRAGKNSGSGWKDPPMSPKSHLARLFKVSDEPAGVPIPYWIQVSVEIG